MTNEFFKPVSGMDVPRFAGVPSFMRLPHIPINHDRLSDVDIGIIGVPWDSGTTNRPGPRHGPRQLRDASTMIRSEHAVSGVRPFEKANCADIGDIGCNPADIQDTMKRISDFCDIVVKNGIIPLIAGGDHLSSLPVLRSLSKNGPLGMIHFDSHTDLFDSYFNGQLYTHGTPFRRALEEGLLDPKRVVQIGIRGTQYDREDLAYAEAVGIRVIKIEEFFERGVKDVLQEAKQIVGQGKTYISYDIDFVDPTFAPGTGTPEVGGPNSFQALEVVRKLEGVNIVGADMVEVSPPFDSSGGTAYLGVSIMFELLCLIASNIHK